MRKSHTIHKTYSKEIRVKTTMAGLAVTALGKVL